MHAIDIRNLRSLHLEEEEMGYDDFRHIADLLASHFASGPNLESIHVSLAWKWSLSEYLVAGPIGTTDTWYQLDKKLAAVACFKRLDINIHYIHGWGVALRNIAKAFEHGTPENAFPILSNKNNSIVRLSLSDSKHI